MSIIPPGQQHAGLNVTRRHVIGFKCCLLSSEPGPVPHEQLSTDRARCRVSDAALGERVAGAAALGAIYDGNDGHGGVRDTMAREVISETL